MRWRVILFLDFDGVLHPDPCTEATQLFENAPRLARVLEGFAGVGVVLSTSWRTVRTERQLLDPLPESLRERVLGMTPRRSQFTPPSALLPYRRQAECMRWLEEHNMAAGPWLALDDRSDGFQPYCENLIVCNSRTGFNDQVAAHLASVLTLANERIGGDIDLMLA